MTASRDDPVRLTDDLSDAERRAIRRSLNAQEEQRLELVEPAKGETVRDVLKRFELGLDDLHGMPRHLVDFPAVYAALDRAERR